MNWLQAFVKYFPAVLAGVIAVEGAVNVPGQTKKQIVIGAITAATQVGEQVPDAHIQQISAMIDGVVTALNASGVFKKSGA